MTKRGARAVGQWNLSPGPPCPKLARFQHHAGTAAGPLENAAGRSFPGHANLTKDRMQKVGPVRGLLHDGGSSGYHTPRSRGQWPHLSKQV